jgi:uncharacterized repeat protein (TIGR03803 family)
MKYRVALGWFVAALFSVSILAPVHAQPATLAVLHSFSGSGDFTESTAALVLSGDILYATVNIGGSGGSGEVFSVNTDGSDFTNLYCFTALSSYTNSDGAHPVGGVLLSSNTLYGTAAVGGTTRSGTVFRVNTDGSDFTNLYTFTSLSASYTNSDGATPISLMLSSNMLYGTTAMGGIVGGGTLFRINTDGTGFTNLHNFNSGSGGAFPQGGLILSGNTLYGEANNGGSGGTGAVFSVTTDGSAYTNVHNFIIYSNGSNPIGTPILSGSTLYGVTHDGGSGTWGTVFRVNTDGSAFTNLHNFNSDTDGAYPHSGLILSGNTLYGTAEANGIWESGTIFSVNTDGSAFTILYSFTALDPVSGTNSDGANPLGVVLSGNTLYGTTEKGGSTGLGTVFALTLPPPTLGIAPAGNQVVITWTDLTSNYVLQTAADLSSGNWSNITNGMVTDGTGYTFTANVTGQTAYFRLQQQ